MDRPLPMDRKLRHDGAALFWAVAAVVAAGLGCSRPPVDPEDTYDRRALLSSLATQVIVPTYSEFTGAAEALRSSTAGYADALAAGPAEAERTSARAAWRAAMKVWQRAEMHQVGPAGSPLMMLGGKSLRDQIYSWPTVNTCRVDQEIVAARYDEEGFFENALVNAYGLAALEYLLFNDSAENTCSSDNAINSSGSWAALGEAERTLRRARYAAAVSRHLVTTATALQQEWDPAGGNFAAQLSSAGEAGSIYDTAQTAVDEVFAAMFYLDFKVKDRKLAVPAGMNLLCPSATCPEAFESRRAAHSGDNIVQNLRAFQTLLMGNRKGDPAREGFDDFLASRGAAELASTMDADIEAAIAQIEALPEGLEAALAEDPNQVVGVHAAVKKITDQMKSQLVTVLNLRIPSEGAADND